MTLFKNILICVLATTTVTAAAAREALSSKPAHKKTVDRKQLIDRWRQFVYEQEQHDEALGAFADLYLSPAWPVHARWFENLQQLGVSVSYAYAADSFGSNGSSKNTNVATLAFGGTHFTVGQLLAVARATYNGAILRGDGDVFHSTLNYITGAGAGAGAPAVAGPAAGGGFLATIKIDGLDPAAPAAAAPGANALIRSDSYFDYTKDLTVAFNGRQEKYGFNLDFTRFILADRLSVGATLPLMYVKHSLDYTVALHDAFAPASQPNFGAYGPNTGLANLFLRRYGADPVRFVKDILAQKGFDGLGGSVGGLGDLSMFVAGMFDLPHVDRFIVGLRGQFPTGKKASASKLWCPELGNGGFSEFSLYAATSLDYNRWLSPHLLTSFGVSAPAHVNRRVPRKITVTNTGPGPAILNTLLPNTPLAMADRVLLMNGRTFNDFDTQVMGFGDTVSSVRLTRGVEFKLRIGNVIKEVFVRRGFLDLFYDLRAKAKDSMSGLPRDIFDVDAARKKTNQVEHKLGFEYSYQLDHESRLRLGGAYTFAGKNVAKTVECTAALNYSF